MSTMNVRMPAQERRELIVQAATRAKPAVVSIVTVREPDVSAGSGYLVTSDGYIVTSIGVLAGATSMTVLVSGDSKLHDARLIDYDCDSGVAVVFVQHLAPPPVELTHWPDGNRQSRVVFIARGISEKQVRDLFAAVRNLEAVVPAKRPRRTGCPLARA